MSDDKLYYDGLVRLTIESYQARIIELEAALQGVDRVVQDVLHDRSKHDVDILLGTLMGLHSHIDEALGEGDTTP